VRDLERSRTKWKLQAREVERADEGQCSNHPGDSDPHETLEGDYLPREDTSLPIRAWHHSYDLGLMTWMLLHVLVGLASLRGTCRLLQSGLTAEGLVLDESGLVEQSIPALSTVRSWLFRIGLYTLQQPVPRRDDWIVILDLTVELGTAKVLAIVGLPQARLQALSEREKQGCSLGHQDVACLALEVLEHSTGEVIANRLECLEARIGRIRQIVADHGSDVQSGLRLYQDRHPEVRPTYDVTHQVAIRMKPTTSMPCADTWGMKWSRPIVRRCAKPVS